MAGSPRASLRRWLVFPQGDTAVRLTLLGLVIALQDLLELPRPAFHTAPLKQLLGVLVFLILGGSLALLLVALRRQVPSWRWLHSRKLQAVVLLLVLAACPTGVLQVGKMATSAFAPPFYPNDGTTLDHYAAQQLLEGHNPYVTTDIVSAIRLYHQDPEHTTALGKGAFAALFPLNYPDAGLLRKVFALEPTGHPDQVLEFESHLSYPALAFLPLVPLVWSGLSTVTPFLCSLCGVILLRVLSVPVQLRVWVLLLARRCSTV
jgi:MFS family permease